MTDRRRASCKEAWRIWLRRPLTAVIGFACVASCNVDAFADESPEPIHLRFDVEGGLANQCPAQPRFVELLRAELPRLTLAPDDARARTFDVRIRRAASGLRGEVVVRSTGGASYARSVEGRDCATLTRALAVVAALASNAIPEQPSQDEAHLPEAPELDTNERAVPADGAPPNATTARREKERASTHQDEPPVWSSGVGLGTELVNGSLPRSAMGYRVYADIERALGRNALVGRLSFAYAGASVPGPALLQVDVQTWTARLEGCFSRRFFPQISLEGCFAATTGSFQASSSGSPAKTARGDLASAADAWLSFGAGARARWHLRSSVFSEVFGNVSVPTTRYEAVSKDSSSLANFAVSQVVGSVGLGFGFYFGGR